MTPPASSISSQVRPRISFLRQPSSRRGRGHPATGRAGGRGRRGIRGARRSPGGRILAQAVGEAGHGVEPAPVDGERAHAVEGPRSPGDGAGGRPGGAPGQLVLADLVRVSAGGPRGAAEERGEMGDPAAGGAVGPELPDLVVLEIGVAEVSQGRPLGAERARWPGRRPTRVRAHPVSFGLRGVCAEVSSHRQANRKRA